eukprot:gene11898-biopygen7284
MQTLMLEEVVAARGPSPDAAPATRAMASSGILDEYQRAEEKLARARGEEWARQRQHVADKVQEKRKGKEDRSVTDRPDLRPTAEDAVMGERLRHDLFLLLRRQPLLFGHTSDIRHVLDRPSVPSISKVVLEGRRS